MRMEHICCRSQWILQVLEADLHFVKIIQKPQTQQAQNPSVRWQ
jgi:hypothetical protein